MKARDLFKLSTRMFKARTSRTLLTILGMGIGIGAILFLVSLGYGLQKVLLETITTSDSLLSLDVTPNKSEDVKLTPDLVDELGKLEGVREVSPAYKLKAKVKFNQVASDATVMVVKPSFLKLDGMKIAQGELLSDENKRGIVISSSFAKVFNQEADSMLGKELTFSISIPKDGGQEEGMEKLESVDVDGTFKIIGFTENEEMIFFAHRDGLKSSLFLPLPEYARLKVRCETNDYLDQARSRLISKGLTVSSLSDTVNEVNKLFKIVNIILAFFGVIALVVSAIGMFNTMTVALLERTQEIGIMKSVGASNSDILLLFISESTIMGFFGGVAGVILGLATSKVFNLGVNLVAKYFGGSPVALFYYPFWFILLILIFATFVGFMTGIIPARRASSIDPLEALKYR